VLPQGGHVSIPGVYVGMGDKIPLGAAMNKGLTIKTGQTHVQAYTKPLLKLIEDGKIDPSFVVTHPASLEEAPAMYKMSIGVGMGPLIGIQKGPL
jgi:threonine dehydrogenase-like Zn-dependent dehydrogenase